MARPFLHSARALLLALLLAAACAVSVAAPAQAAVGFRAQTCKTQTFTLLGAFTMNKPAGVQSGDLLVATMRVTSILSIGFAVPFGWTELTSVSDDGAKIFYRVAGAAEPTTYNFGSVLAVGATLAGSVVAFTGADPAAPFGGALKATGTSNSVALPTVTSTRNGSVRYSNVTTSSAATSSFLSQTDACDVSSGGVSVANGWASADAGNATLYSNSLSMAAPWVAQSMIIQPASPCITGGLTMGAPSAVSFPSTALDGKNRTVSTNATISVSDMTDTAVGWNLSATSTRFTSAGGDALADTATTVTGLAITAGATNCGLPISSSTAFPMTLPAGSTAPAAAKIYSSEIGSGLGQANLAYSFALALPGNARIGTYTSTWTFTIAGGP